MTNKETSGDPKSDHMPYRSSLKFTTIFHCRPHIPTGELFEGMAEKIEQEYFLFCRLFL